VVHRHKLRCGAGCVVCGIGDNLQQFFERGDGLLVTSHLSVARTNFGAVA
jgi:hypothetical protein